MDGGTAWGGARQPLRLLVLVLLTLPAAPLTPPARRYVVPLLWLPVAAALMWRGVAVGGLSPTLLPLTLVVGVLIWQLME